MKKLLIYSILFIPLIGFSQADVLGESVSNLDESVESYLSKDTMDDGLSLFDIRHNAVYNMDVLLFCYERIIPLKEDFGLTVTTGFLIWDPVNIVGELGILMGGTKHFAEMGIGYHFNPSDSDWNMGIYRVGYRMQLTKGFLFKASLSYANRQNILVPLLGIGYAF